VHVAAATLFLFLVAPGTAPATASATPPFSVCALITSEELAAAQGSELAEATATAQVRDGLAVSRCFFRTRDFARSVSLEVTRADSKSNDSDGLRRRWQAMFHDKSEEREREREPVRRDDEAEEAAERGVEEAEREAKPESIAGLGDEAFWLGTSSYGVLYVLESDLFLRLSVGGPGDRDTKLGQSRAFAAKALARLAGGR